MTALGGKNMAGFQRSLFEGNDNVEKLDPREYLRRRMAMKGRSATQLAEEIDVSVQTIYNIVGLKRPISHKLAIKLARYFDESVDIWLSEAVSIDSDATSLTPVRKSVAKDARSEVAPSDIPLFKGLSESGSGILVDREINALLRADEPGVRITPYSLNQIEAASYDLTVGLIITDRFEDLSPEEWGILARHLYNDPLNDQEKKKVKSILQKAPNQAYTRGKVTLGKLDSVTIVAREHLEFSSNFVADVGSVSRHARHGLLVNHGFQIDPGYVGSIIVTAIEIIDTKFELEAGQKLVSLAIRKLPRAPDKSYNELVDRKLRLIGRDLEELLKSLFEVERLQSGTFRAHSAFGATFTDETDEDVVLIRAVAWVLDSIEQNGSGGIDTGLREVLQSTVLKGVLVELEHVDTLIRLFDVKATDKIKKGKEYFDRHNQQDRQTLWDVLSHLGVDPIAGLEKLIRS
jgi:plasmid maintenance system antidote protein VapI/deoxycytidine triphosphate deaminase